MTPAGGLIGYFDGAIQSSGQAVLGIFCENAVNRILDDVARACRPRWAIVRGEFTTRGGMHTTVEARYPRPKR